MAKIKDVCTFYDSSGECAKPDVLEDASHAFDRDSPYGNSLDPLNVIGMERDEAERELQRSVIRQGSLIEDISGCYYCRARPKGGGIDQGLPNRQSTCIFYYPGGYKQMTVGEGKE